jgi:hypothetical protein
VLRRLGAGEARAPVIAFAEARDPWAFRLITAPHKVAFDAVVQVAAVLMLEDEASSATQEVVIVSLVEPPWCVSAGIALGLAPLPSRLNVSLDRP